MGVLADHDVNYSEDFLLNVLFIRWRQASVADVVVGTVRNVSKSYVSNVIIFFVLAVSFWNNSHSCDRRGTGTLEGYLMHHHNFFVRYNKDTNREIFRKEYRYSAYTNGKRFC